MNRSRIEEKLVCSLVGGSVALAVFSRLLVAAGAPSAIVFLHGATAVLAALLSARLPARATRRFQAVSIAGFTSIVVASGTLNRAGGFDSAAVWLLFVEPFLLAYAVRACSSRNQILVLIAGCLACCLVQVPFCAAQHVFPGLQSHDLVTGTFVGQRSGSHVAGALCGVALVVLLASLAFQRGSTKQRIAVAAVAALLCYVMAITDSKLAVAALAAPFFYFAWRAARSTSASSSVLVFLVVSAAVTIAYAVNRKHLPENLVMRSLEAKVAGPTAVWEKAGHNLSVIAIGAGPAKSISRLALLSSPYYRKPTSPVSSLGLQAEEITSWVLETAPKSQSSVLSPFSSWGSLLGDLGILGALSFCLMLASLWTHGNGEPEGLVSNALLVYVSCLSVFQLWFEEPGLTLVLMTLVAALPRVNTTESMRK